MAREALMDIIYFKIFKSKKVDNKLLRMIKILRIKRFRPIHATLMLNIINEKISIFQKVKSLGSKLKMIEKVVG